jgi:Tol biopolymer transport system component
MVPTGLWFGGALTHLVRPEPKAVTAANAPTTVEPATTVAGPTLTAVAPPDLIAVQPNLEVAGSDFSLRSGLPSAVRAEPISLRDTPVVGSSPKTKAQTRGRRKTDNVQLSPDGKRVAFDSDRRGARAVYVVDRDGKNLRRVSGVGVAERPVWSPNSRRLAFMRAGRNGVWNLWTVELESGDLRQVSFDGSGRPSGASWFPNSKRIGYSHGTEFRIVDVKNGRTQRFATPRRGRIGASAVSPDGRRIVFRAGANATWLLDLSNDGPEQMRRILTDPSARAFSWAPDGKQLAYFSRRKGDWIVIPQ